MLMRDGELAAIFDEYLFQLRLWGLPTLAIDNVKRAGSVHVAFLSTATFAIIFPPLSEEPRSRS